MSRNDGYERKTPTHPGCPCLGDPAVESGADANGFFYITTNEFPFFSRAGFNGAQIYATAEVRPHCGGDAKTSSASKGAPISPNYGEGNSVTHCSRPISPSVADFRDRQRWHGVPC